MEKKRKLLTIGQFAALHGINKKTLMWYDEIGLFCPAAIHPDNGYRYYSYYQSAVLETILLLRELGVPVEEIRGFMKERSAAGMQRLLHGQLEALQRELDHLKAVRETLARHSQNMQTLLTMDISETHIIEREEHSLVSVGIDQDAGFDKLVEQITQQTKRYQLRRLHDASYGIMTPVESLYGGDAGEGARLFIEIPFPIEKEGLHIQPAGQYVRAFYQEGEENARQCYWRMRDYAAAHALRPTGFAYEIILNGNVIERMEDALIQVEIPVKTQ